MWAKKKEFHDLDKEAKWTKREHKIAEKLKKMGLEDVEEGPVDLLTAIDEAMNQVELMTAVDEAMEHINFVTAINEAMDHVELMSAVNEAFDHVELLSAIDEAVAQVNMIDSKKDETSWGTITLSACGVTAAIVGAGYMVSRVKAFKNDDVYESLV